MGLEDMIKEGEQALDGQDSSNQQVQSEQSGGNESRNDTMLDSVVDEVASKEGVSAALDPEINNIVNDEANKIF